MRHRCSGRKFSRIGSHRQSMFGNMVISLVDNMIIKTTLAKAKELRRVIEPIITLSKKDTLSNRRLVFSRIRNRNAVGRLFNILGPHFLLRHGGYTRILKCGFRRGDNSPMAYIELIDRSSLKNFLKGNK